MVLGLELLMRFVEFSGAILERLIYFPPVRTIVRQYLDLILVGLRGWHYREA